MLEENNQMHIRTLKCTKYNNWQPVECQYKKTTTLTVLDYGCMYTPLINRHKNMQGKTIAFC
jgi:hypothetical protein